MSYEDDEANERFEQWLDRCAERERQDFIEAMPALMAEAPPPVLMPNEVALYGFDDELTVVEIDDPSTPPLHINVPLLQRPSRMYVSADESTSIDPPSVAVYRRAGGRVYRRVQ